MMCSGLSVRVDMPGRARTGSRAFRTLVDCSSYLLAMRQFSHGYKNCHCRGRPRSARGGPLLVRPSRAVPAATAAARLASTRDAEEGRAAVSHRTAAQAAAETERERPGAARGDRGTHRARV